MDTPAIVIDHFTKRYGAREAVHDLCMTVPRGSIFGLLGQNGAGKSTTIKTMMNLLQPTSGTITVLGHDTVADSLQVRRRVGYLPEDPSYYIWMTVQEILRFCAGLYDTWDPKLAESLVERLGLPKDRKLRALSRGMQAKVGLVMALAPRPELLVLDDPTSGLDPVVRHEFLEAIIANVQAEGGTVFFSTHLLHEMERVADEVAIIHEGRLLMRGSLEQIKAQCKQVRVVYPTHVPETFPVEGLVRAQRNSHEALLTVNSFAESLPERLYAHGAESVAVIDLSLEEIFIETVKGAKP